jgi:hypothetical protein
VDRVGDDFNPVTIRISDKGNVVHLAFLELLDKCHSFLLEALARLFNIINRDTNVTETSARFLVAIGVTLELGI